MVELVPRPLPRARRHLELRVGHDNIATIMIDGLCYLRAQMEVGAELLFADVQHVIITREIK